jgi:hypothetical protein
LTAGQATDQKQRIYSRSWTVLQGDAAGTRERKRMGERMKKQAG